MAQTAFLIVLTGSQEVPSVTTTASGYGMAIYDSVAKTLEYTITVRGLDWGSYLGLPASTASTADNVTAARFMNAALGANGASVLEWKTQDTGGGSNNFGVLPGDFFLTASGSSARARTSTVSTPCSRERPSARSLLFTPISRLVGHPTGEIRGQFFAVATDASETVQGTFNDDIIVGLGGNDILKGLDGTDILIGRAGNNTYDGGDELSAPQPDWADYRYDPAGININLATGIGTNGFGGTDDFIVPDFFGDDMIGVQNIAGSAQGDTIVGSDEDNVIRGRGGNNNLDGGAHSTFGGDTADYSEALGGVTISLLSGGTNGYGGTDTLANFEHLIGSAHNDVLTGNAGDNIFRGGAGNNTYNGGGGFDSVFYDRSTAGVSINLTGGTEQFNQIDQIRGSAFNDTITGDGQANILDGSFGSDILSGGGGDDQLFGGLNTGVESDQLDGGEGNDVLVVITHRPITEHIPGNGGIARGGNGNDELRGGSDSELIGGFGADIYTSNVGGSSFVSYAGSACRQCEP